MAPGNGVIQAELSIELGKIGAQLNQAAALIAKFAQGAGSGMRPANQAVETLGKSITETRQHAVQAVRTFDYFTSSAVEMTGASQAASAAIGGIGSTLTAVVLKAGSFAVGLVAAQAALTVISSVLKDAKAEAEGTAKAIKEVQDRIDAIGKSKRQVMLQEIAKLDAVLSAGKGLPKYVMGEGSDEIENPAIAAADAARAKYAKDRGMAESGLMEYRKTLWKEYLATESDLNQKAAIEAAQRGEEQARAQVDLAIRAGKTISDQQIAEAKRVAAERLRITTELAKADQVIWQNEAAGADRGNFPDAFYDDKTWKEMVAAQKPKPYDDKAMFGPGNNKGEIQFLDDYTEGLLKMRDVAISVGGAVGSAFAGIGQAVGGSLGAVLNQIGQVISQLVAMAIATQGSLPFPYNIVAMAATGAAMIAGMISTMAQVPAYETGTLSVPRTGLAMVHQGEAILPADGTAQAYRSGGRNVTVNLSVTAMDGASVYRVITDNRGQVARAFREMARDGVG